MFEFFFFFFRVKLVSKSETSFVPAMLQNYKLCDVCWYMARIFVRAGVVVACGRLWWLWFEAK